MPALARRNTILRLPVHDRIMINALPLKMKVRNGVRLRFDPVKRERPHAGLAHERL
jgi:hypothetical protein